MRAAWSDRTHGDLRAPAGAGSGEALDRFAAAVTGRPARVTRVHQVHGSTVRVVAGPDAGPPPEADALVTADPSVRLAVVTADCAAVALGSDEGVFAAVHAGWRGLVAGVVEAAVAAMRSLGATTVRGALGPTVHPECYEFSEADLEVVAARYGDTARGVTAEGRPALDLPAAVAAALAGAGARPVPGVDRCTACSGRDFSHRARGDAGRQALVVWSVAGG